MTKTPAPAVKVDIIERLKFDAARCEINYSKGIASNIEEAIAEIARLREQPIAVLPGGQELYPNPPIDPREQFKDFDKVKADIEKALATPTQAQIEAATVAFFGEEAGKYPYWQRRMAKALIAAAQVGEPEATHRFNNCEMG